ncbi:MAG TPA: efflux RND transporter permease subunit [Gemmatimonadales bacterium]|nr:efflux RND transporter permease subunit [Gemmatimonadales bacterium]
MLNRLIAFAVGRPGIVTGLAAALVIFGLNVLSRAKVDIFPEFAPPQVQIQTEAPGFSPEQVEVLVTRPIESVLNGMNGLAVLRSQSIQGLSLITAVLGEDIDVRQARQLLAERLGEVTGRLPAGVEPPVVSPLTSSSSTILVVGVTSETRSLQEVRSFVDWTLKPRLLAAPGVAKVAVFGGEVRQFQVQVHPARLRALAVSVPEVVEAARRATGVRGTGVIDNASQRIVVRAEGQLTTPEAIGASVLRPGEASAVRLRDVADVVAAPETPFGDGTVNGRRGCVIVVSAQLGANTRDAQSNAEAALTDLAPAIAAAGLTLHPGLFRPTEFIDLAIGNLTRSLLLGAVLVSVILLLFLGDVRAAAVSLTAIPLSLLAAVAVLGQFGFGLNTLTLGGLAIALGEVVDDAIIDVENIARRLRINRQLAEPRSPAAVVLTASVEVRSSVTYATFVVALVFLPVLLLSGVQGALFRPLALAYILATLASLLVALTVTPALTLLVLGRRERRRNDPAVLAWLKARYRAALEDMAPHPRTVSVVALILCLGAAATIPWFGTSFLPEFREGHYQIHMSLVPGSSLEESVRLGNIVTAALLADSRVRSVAQRAGRAELSEDTWGTHYSELEVDIRPLKGRESETLQQDLRERLGKIPGVNFAIRGFLAERIEETLTGSTASLVLKFYGDDLDSLDAAARRGAAMLGTVRGATDVQYDPPPVVPGLTIRLRPADVSGTGLRSDEVLSAIETATRGTEVGQVYEGGKTTKLVVVLDSASRSGAAALGRLPLFNTDGRMVELHQVADLLPGSGRFVVAHQGSRRLVTVTANVQGRDEGSFADEVQRRLRRDVVLPSGVYAEIGGTARARKEAVRELMLYGGLAGAGIIMLLSLAFGEGSRLMLVLANLPFAMVGGVLAVFATGGVLSLGSLVGFVTLFGIATRNAVMLISHYEHLVAREGMSWGRETALRGAIERLGPILMTAAVTGLALLPLAIGSGDPGREIEGPMAIVILGGLVTSTLLSLFVLPVLALALGRFGARPEVPSIPRS